MCSVKRLATLIFSIRKANNLFKFVLLNQPSQPCTQYPPKILGNLVPLLHDLFWRQYTKQLFQAWK